MSRKTFTAEEINLLRQNPFTYKVTNRTLSFTKEFKELFMEKYNAGMLPQQIFAEHGYDQELLGDRRIRGISHYLRAQYAATEGNFAEGKKSKVSCKPLSEKEELKQLRQEVDYLKQEIDFLKKISSIRITRK